jgi:hypothetical protein
MDERNYVADNGDGTYTVVVDGVAYPSFENQQWAESYYNEKTANGNYPQGQPTPDARTPYTNLTPIGAGGGLPTGNQPYSGYAGPSYPSGGGGGQNFSGLWGSLTQSNQMDFDERKRQFDKTLELEAQKLGLSREQFEEMKRQFQVSTGVSLAESLMQAATQLRGPQDWIKYNEFVNGGKDIFGQLYGNQAAPAFSAPTGYSKEANVTDLLGQLGVPNLGNLMQGPVNDNWYDDVQQIYQARKAAGMPWTREAYMQIMSKKGVNPDVAGQIFDGSKDFAAAMGRYPTNAEMTAWVKQLQPGFNPLPAQGQTPSFPSQVSQPAGIQPPAPNQPDVIGQPVGAVPGPSDGQAIGQPVGAQPFGGASMGANLLQGATAAANPMDTNGTLPAVTNPTVSGQTNPMVPLPHQINPAVWDALTGSARQNILGSVEAGNTPSGAWDPQDFLDKLNAARPKGVAPRRVNTQWGQVGSAF